MIKTADWRTVDAVALPAGWCNEYDTGDSDRFIEPCPALLLQECHGETRCVFASYRDGCLTAAVDNPLYIDSTPPHPSGPEISLVADLPQVLPVRPARSPEKLSALVTMDLIRRVIKGNAELENMLDGLEQRPVGTNQHSELGNNVPKLKRPEGNSKAKALRRLRKDAWCAPRFLCSG